MKVTYKTNNKKKYPYLAVHSGDYPTLVDIDVKDILIISLIKDIDKDIDKVGVCAQYLNGCKRGWVVIIEDDDDYTALPSDFEVTLTN